MFRRRCRPPQQSTAAEVATTTGTTTASTTIKTTTSQFDDPQASYDEPMPVKVVRMEQANRDLLEVVQEMEAKLEAQQASFVEQIASIERDKLRMKVSLELLMQEKDNLVEKAAANKVLLETICELCAETSTAAPPRQQLHAILRLICRRIMGRWLVRELEELRGLQEDESSSGVQAALQCIGNASRIHLFTGMVEGPARTVYEGGAYAVNIVLPGLYPYELPRIIFKSKIFHPNISSQTGDIIGLVRAHFCLHYLILRTATTFHPYLNLITTTTGCFPRSEGSRHSH